MWIELPVLFPKDGQPDYESLGLKVEEVVEECPVMFNVDLIDTVNPGASPGESTVRAAGGSFRVKMEYSKLKEIIQDHD
ncbi:MAG TPA: hypothetical protein PKA53_10745 [Sphingobacterium sp.]|nr:hypothetical protein [Sphingobacterium sp.]